MLRREFLAAFAAAVRRERLDEAVALVEKFTASGEVRAAALRVRQGRFELARGFGQATPDTVFLLASITKPMTAAGVMILRDRGAIALGDPVAKFLPEFTGGDRDLVTVRHLLTHTSGLPDMLPDNTALRRRHAPLADFVAGACRTPLLFRPGAQVRYQSMGILLLAEICQRITRRPFRDFLRTELFEPLGMRATSLGLGGRAIPGTAQCQVAGDDDWNWNSPYWRDFGAPWGGAHSTTADVARFLEFFLNPRARIFKRETAAEMITNQN
ncbi:MAG: serine hydrolase domain-containing protein, partial [Terriglobia bacterium]